VYLFSIASAAGDSSRSGHGGLDKVAWRDNATNEDLQSPMRGQLFWLY